MIFTFNIEGLLMKKRLLLFTFWAIVLLGCPVLALGQLSRTIHNNTPGALRQTLGEDLHKIESLVLEGSLNSTDLYTLSLMQKLKTVDMRKAVLVDNNGNKSFSFLPDGISYSRSMQEVTVPQYITVIGKNAFTKCQNLRKVTLGDNIEEIHAKAFSLCEKLTDINCPQKLHYIGEGAFMRTKELRAFNLTQVDTIRRIAFYNSGIEHVDLKNIKRIDDGAFAGNSSLRAITVAPQNAYYKVENNMLLSKDGLKLIQFIPGGATPLVNLPVSVSFLSGSCFEGCPTIKEIRILGNVEAIPNSCFRATQLERIFLPETLKKIDIGAFDETSKTIKEIHFKRATPPEMEKTAFGIMMRPLHLKAFVPKGAKETYEANPVIAEVFESVEEETTDTNEPIIELRTQLPKGELFYIGITTNETFSVDWGDGQYIEYPAGDYSATGKTIRKKTESNKIRIKGNALAISRLNFTQQHLSSIKLEPLPNLTHLYLSDNKLAHLEISAQKGLKFLAIDKNALQEINLSSLKELQELRVLDNNLTQINLANNTKLTKLVISNNPLDGINLSSLTELISFEADNTGLTRIDFSNNKKLQELDLDGNKLTYLDVKTNPELTWLYAGNNRISNIDLSNNSKLRQLNLEGNLLKHIELTAQSELIELILNNNPLKKISLKNKTKISRLQLINCGISELPELTEMERISLLYIDKNNLTSINLSHAKRLKKLSISNNNLSSIDLSTTPSLQWLNISANKLSQVNLKSNPKLYSVLLNDNSFGIECLNEVIDALPNITSISFETSIPRHKELDISNNPGTEKANLKKAEGKGWRVIATTHTMPLPKQQTEAKLFPNPAQSFFSCYGLPTKKHVLIYTQMGELVAKTALADGERFDITPFAEGNYYVIVEETQQCLKLVVSK